MDAVYAGSFDPLTNGHVWVIEEAKKMFNKIIILVGNNPMKTYTFSTEERMKMIKTLYPDITVDVLGNEYTQKYCERKGIGVQIRGIRNVRDLEFEQEILFVNREIAKHVQSVYLIPPSEVAGLSSSLVKSLIGNSQWQFVVGELVPENVFWELNKKYSLEYYMSPDISWMGIEDALMYCRPGIFYHSLQHIYETIQAFKEVKDIFTQPESVHVIAAICYHDIKDTEKESAEYAFEKFKDKENYDAELIRDMILATEDHVVTGREIINTMIDCDLSIFGKDPVRFAEYERQVFAESCYLYRNFGLPNFPEIYRKERNRIVKSFIDREYIYTTEYFREKNEKQARENLKILNERLSDE
jgi:pantetheine-phosphate adenylyltransferase